MLALHPASGAGYGSTASISTKKRFTARYNVEFLIYYEWFDSIVTAIDREKEVKKWGREKKESLINSKNIEWRFLNDEVSRDIYSLLY